MKSILIDILGGDFNEEEILKGIKEIYPNVKSEYEFVIIGPKEIILKYFKEDEVKIIDINKEVTNNTSAMAILHDLEDTALVNAYNYLKENEDTVGLLTVSATGCVFVGAIFKLGLIKGIKNPVLATELYRTDFTRFVMVDCGANLDITKEQYLDFARIGMVFEKALGINNPKIALANLGVEEKKGNRQMKEAYQLLKESNLNFIGNVEFNRIFKDSFDVLVCDGAIGNCILKNAEGVGKAILDLDLPDNIKDTINHLFNYNDQGAAILLGPNKIVLKAHGAANKNTIASSIEELIRLDKGRLIESLKEEYSK